MQLTVIRKQTNPLEIIEANCILPIRLLHFGQENKVPCFINTDTVLDKRINAYSLSKSQFKEWLEFYSTHMESVNMEIEHFYGPHDDDSKFVAFIIDKLLANAHQIDLTLGEQKRSFIYIDDVVEAFLRVIELSDTFHRGFHSFQVASANSIQIKELVLLAKRLAGNTKTSLNFGAIPYRENEIMELSLDTSGLGTYLVGRL